MFFVRHGYEYSLITRSSQRHGEEWHDPWSIVGSMSVLQHPVVIVSSLGRERRGE